MLSIGGLKRFDNIKYLPYGSVMLFLDEQIARCRANRELASDEMFESLYRECEVSFILFKKQVIKMFYEMECE